MFDTPALQGPDAADPDEVEAHAELLPIGKVAQLLGVSERTLRYYEEIGLIAGCARKAGQRRRYAEADVKRITEIRELQQVMGYSLEEIKTIFSIRGRFEAIRAAYRSGSGRAEQARLLEEAATLMDEQSVRVRAKVTRLEAILADLETRSARCRALYDEITGKTPA